MIALTDRERSALHALANSTEGKILLEYLKRDLADKDEANRQKEGPELYRGQGGAIEIDELIKLVI